MKRTGLAGGNRFLTVLSTAGERLRPSVSPTLGSRLAWLVIGSLLPFVLLLVVSLVVNYRDARDSAVQQALDVARGTALAVEGELRATIVSLEALAASPSLATGDLETFRREAATLAAKNFPGASVALLDLDGQQFFNTVRPPGSTLPRRPNLEALERVKATRQPAVSDIFMATLQQIYIVPVDVPVFGADGQVRAILSLAPSLQTFAEVIGRQHVPANWVVSILDRKGVVVSRTRNPERYVGQPALADFLTLLQQQAEGTADVEALDGIHLLAGWSRPGPSGWSVAVGIPHQVYFRSQRNALAAALAIAALTTTGALALSRLVARRIAEPVQALTKLAEQTALAGHSGAVAPLGLREADAVADALIASTRERNAALNRLHEIEAQSRADLELQVAARTAELHAAQAQLLQSQRMEAVGQLTAGVAHDFNNLLQVQMSCLHMLLDHVRGGEEPTKYAQIALQSSEKAAKLTHSLLSFSRKQMLQPEAVDVPALFDRLHVLLSRTLDPRIGLEMEVIAGTASPLADPAQLETALLNLCLNARDAMEVSGGRVSVRACNGNALSTDVPSNLDPACCVVLSVEDEGCGMDAATVARVREPFFTTKAVGRGSGLGLSMVEGFARQSGGELHLLSWPGVGTRVQMFLPRAVATAREVATPASVTRTVRGAGRVLLVDDEALVRELVSDVLQSAGFDVAQAATGEDALLALGSNGGFDAVVTDYAMPGMTGGELVSKVRLLWPNLPALIITGFAEVAQLGTVPQGVQTLRKPFQVEELAEAVARLIKAERATAS